MLSVRNISYKIMKKSFYFKGYNEKFPVKVPSVYAVVVVCVVVKIVKVPSVGIKYVSGETAQLASFATVLYSGLFELFGRVLLHVPCFGLPINILQRFHYSIFIFFRQCTASA